MLPVFSRNKLSPHRSLSAEIKFMLFWRIFNPRNESRHLRESMFCFFFFYQCFKIWAPTIPDVYGKLHVAFWWENLGLFSGTTEKGKSLVSSGLFLGIFHKKDEQDPSKPQTCLFKGKEIPPMSKNNIKLELLFPIVSKIVVLFPCLSHFWM